nr:MAG TPA: hypothetical protein [Caudoviricetes sp.]
MTLNLFEVLLTCVTQAVALLVNVGREHLLVLILILLVYSVYR